MWFTSKFLGNTGAARASALVFARVAQLAAHLHGKEGVAGSSPAVSIFIK